MSGASVTTTGRLERDLLQLLDAVARMRADPDPDSDREACELAGTYWGALDSALVSLLAARIETRPDERRADDVTRSLRPMVGEALGLAETPPSGGRGVEPTNDDGAGRAPEGGTMTEIGDLPVELQAAGIREMEACEARKAAEDRLAAAVARVVALRVREEETVRVGDALRRRRDRLEEEVGPAAMREAWEGLERRNKARWRDGAFGSPEREFEALAAARARLEAAPDPGRSREALEAIGPLRDAYGAARDGALVALLADWLDWERSGSPSMDDGMLRDLITRGLAPLIEAAIERSCVF